MNLCPSRELRSVQQTHVEFKNIDCHGRAISMLENGTIPRASKINRERVLTRCTDQMDNPKVYTDQA